MEGKFLLLETSGAIGQVGLGFGPQLLAQESLDIHHRHNRDLAPTIASLLQRAGWRPKDLQGVIVSIGPGSYTGLRVGLMSAKTLAYATGCALTAVETFACLAQQVPPDVCLLDVISDAQQGNLYVQSFEREAPSSVLRPTLVLSVEPIPAWLARRAATAWVTGPGLVTHAKQLAAAERTVPAECWLPKLDALLKLGIEQPALSRDDLLGLEPLYLRPSSAEQKWNTLGKA